MMRTQAGLGLVLLLCAGCQKDVVGDGLRELGAADAATRKHGAAQLANQKDPRIAPALARVTTDPYPDVRCAAAVALGTQDAGVAVEPLLAMLAARPAGYDCVIEPLGRQRDARAAAPLMAEENRRRAGTALAALIALGPGAVGPLVNALRTERDARRVDVYARAIAQAGGKDTLPALLGLLIENDRATNANAAFALGVLGDPAAVPELLKAADAGIGTAAAALARTGPAGQEALLARLDHPKEFQRRAAHTALRQASDPALVATLDASMGGSDDTAAERSARLLALLAVPGKSPSPLQDAASAALDRAWDRGDSRAIAGGAAYYVPKHPEGDDRFIDALEMHGNPVLAAALIGSPSEPMRAAGAEWQRQQPKPPAATAESDATP